jgi:hypothetical protein
LPMPKRKLSSASDARRKVDRLRALRSSPRALHDFAMEILAEEGSPELVKLALESLGEEIRPDDGPILRQIYNDFDVDGVKKDPGGNVRVEVLKALWHLRSGDDLALALRARNTSERTLQANGEMIRAAGLALLGALDPSRGCLEAVLVLGRDDSHPLTESSHMTGEPALTAVRLLGETLRGLASLAFATLEPILVDLASREDDGLLVAVCDVLVELLPSPGLAPIVRKLLDSPSRGEVYEFLVSSIVASRRMDLIELVLESLPTEMSQKRLRSALEALRLAPRTPTVESAITELEARLARQTPPPV